MLPRSKIMAIAAMSADGKLSDHLGGAARFPSRADQAHLEVLISKMDGVLFGANTLRAYGTSFPIRDRQLLAERQKKHGSPQPIHFVCSRSGNISKQLPFFSQPFPRGLITSPDNVAKWEAFDGFSQVIALENDTDWPLLFAQLHHQGLDNLAILGGGELLASIVEQDCLDELWLTICPILLGGKTAPTPIGGQGLLQEAGLVLELLEQQAIASEVFLHYRVKK